MADTRRSCPQVGQRVLERGAAHDLDRESVAGAGRVASPQVPL